MKKVYEAENPALVWSARIAVEDAGIPCTLRNEFAGGASGLLSPLDAWPELWVIDDRHATRATTLLRDVRLATLDRLDWFCGRCDESNVASFDVCWKCGNPGPAA